MKWGNYYQEPQIHSSNFVAATCGRKLGKLKSQIPCWKFRATPMRSSILSAKNLTAKIGSQKPINKFQCGCLLSSICKTRCYIYNL